VIKGLLNMMLSSSAGSLYKKEKPDQRKWHNKNLPHCNFFIICNFSISPNSPSIFTPAALYANDKFSSNKIRN